MPRPAGPSKERIAPQDAMFFAYERPGMPFHAGLVATFLDGSWRLPSGEIDLPRIGSHFDARLGAVPRLVQRAANRRDPRRAHWVPVEGVRAASHLRSIQPPAERLTREAVIERYYAEPLDPRRPLWEIGVLDGPEPGTFSLAWKVHHALIDGVSGLALFRAMLGPPADQNEHPPAAAAPSPSWGSLLREAAADPERLLPVARALLRPASPALFGRPGAPVQIRTLVLDRRDLRRARCAFNISVNDISVNDLVLAAVTGAVRALLQGASPPVGAHRVRALLPTTLHPGVPHGAATGNRLGISFIDLPVHIGETSACLAAVAAAPRYPAGGANVELLARLSLAVPRPLRPAGWRMMMAARTHSLLASLLPALPRGLALGDAPLVGLEPVTLLYEGNFAAMTAVPFGRHIYLGVTTSFATSAEAAAFLAFLRGSFADLGHAAGAWTPGDNPETAAHAVR